MSKEENINHCTYVLLMVGELKEKYCQKKGVAPKLKWSRASALITEILPPISENKPIQHSNDVKDPDSPEQELMNIIIRSMALKQLEGKAKDHCQKGHEMEGVYSKQLLAEPDFLWGKIDQINQVGLVQKRHGLH